MTDITETAPGESGFRVTGRLVLGALVAFFLVVAGVNAVMIRLAVSTFGGVETDSAYRAGLQFRTAQEAARMQAALGWSVTVHAERRDGDAVLTVSVTDPADKPVSMLGGQAVLQRPVDRRRDITIRLVEAGPGLYRGQAALDEAGVYDLALSLDRGDTRFRSRNRLLLP